ncbi:AAA family ATPase [Alkaliphilus serpentinus]|uniref:AAA family ATPase n=1 Tax=Alkaliphilus serpentinus TaxID=1482731 RepID=A0A833HM81_9FIRM|nr:AAA family ATPase [Alkaliphilus serpentinus]KAB3527205.1 AAA family ATPase [Alkaliphilus serpentinus]
MSNFVIKKIYANNFKGIPYREIKEISDLMIIDFAVDGITVLSGPNGYGKTTLFDIVEIIISKKITRFSSTRFGNVIIKDNGLLNNKQVDGLIGVEFSNKSQTLTILGKIPQNGGRGEIDSDIASVQLYYYRGSLFDVESDMINLNNLSNACLDKISLFNSINSIKNIPELSKFNTDTFNLFYYISQEESTHFLKEKENEKLSKLDSLVDINHHIRYSGLLDKLATNNVGGIIKMRIKEIDQKLENKYDELSTEVLQSEKVEFIKVFENLDIPWDKDQLEEESLEVLKSYKNEVVGTKQLILYTKDFDSFIINQKLENIAVSNDTFNNLLTLKKHQLINDSYKGINNEALSKKIDKYQNNVSLLQLKEVYNDPEIESKLDYKDIEKWSGLLKIECITKEDYDDKILKINNIKKRLDNGAKLYDDLLTKRTTFINAFKKAIDIKVENQYLNSKKCPVCGSDFNEKSSLFSYIDKMAAYLKESTDSNQENLEVAKNELKMSIASLYNVVKGVNIIQDINSEDYTKLEVILNNKQAQKNILQLLESIVDLKLDVPDDIQSLESFRVYIKSKKQVYSDEFLIINDNYNLEKLYTKYYKSIYKELLKYSLLQEKLDQKNKFLDHLISLKENERYNKVYNEITELTKQLILLDRAKQDMSDCRDIIKKEINEFREKLINDIEIPLYLYTGKILQNYQRGLGVFIQKTDKTVKFVPDMGTEHEIINSFSSGQLSGFVIAFMLVMNKVYSGRDSSINTILIDDPVQTMDDINIASLVEVLRNEFNDKQILLSSHETNKAIYMLYKFSKYNISYDMKDVSRIVKQIS